MRPLLWIGAACALAAGARGEQPPDWLKPYLGEDMPEWRETSANVGLLDAAEVRFVSADRVTVQIRRAERITTEAGREHGLIGQPYNADLQKIVSARVWAITADHKTTKAYATKDFLDRVAQYDNRFWDARRLISLDVRGRLEIGGVLAVEYQIESQSGIFDTRYSFLSNEPQCHSVFDVIPVPGGRLQWYATSDAIPPPVTGSAPGALRWERNRLGAVAGDKPKDFHPNPLVVLVRCAAPGQPDGRLPSWQEFANLVVDVIEPRIVVAPEIKAKAEALVAGKVARWDRIRALTEFVQKEVTYLAITLDTDYLAGYRPHAAAEVLQNRYGDCKDKATLLSALLRAVGDNGLVTLVFAQNPSAIRRDWPSASFNHAIALIPADDQVPAWWPVVEAGEAGRLVVFDPTNPDTPLGALPSSDQGGYGLIVTKQRAGLVRLPVEDVNRAGLRRRTQATLDPFGALSAEVEETHLGAGGAMLHAERVSRRTEGFSRLLEGRVHESLPRVQNVQWTDNWDPAEARYRLNFNLQTEKYARQLGADEMLVNPSVLGTSPPLPAWKTAQEGIVWIPTQSLSDEVRLALPKGFSPEELPEEWNREQGTASCNISYRIDGRAVVFRCQFTQPAAFLDKAGYETYRLFLQKVAEARRRPIVLRRDIASQTP
jgi:transglutaminase-like putative cysteine protease